MLLFPLKQAITITWYGLTFSCSPISFANANVLLVLGELMSEDNNDDANDDDEGGGASRSAIPLIGGAILLAQATMTAATKVADYYTRRGVGRKVLFLAGLVTLPIRCALVIYWKDAGNAFLLSTQILDGLGGGFFGLLHPYLVADITFGSGRFNLISEYRSKDHLMCMHVSLPNLFLSLQCSGIDCLLFRTWWHNEQFSGANGS